MSILQKSSRTTGSAALYIKRLGRALVVDIFAKLHEHELLILYLIWLILQRLKVSFSALTYAYIVSIFLEKVLGKTYAIFIPSHCSDNQKPSCGMSPL